MSIVNVSIVQPPPQLFSIRPVPLPPHFRSHLPVVKSQPEEAIHVADLFTKLNPVIKVNRSTNSQPLLVTTLLGLFSWLGNVTTPNEDSKSPANDRNQLESRRWKREDERAAHHGHGNDRQSIRNRYNCRYGFQGRYCDPCGVTFWPPLVKIVGGFEATPHSWPSAAYIVFNYKADVFLQDQGVFYKLEEQMVCGGSLISRDTGNQVILVFLIFVWIIKYCN